MVSLSRQYEAMMIERYKKVLANHNINEENVKGVCLSAHRTEYTVTFKDGTQKVIPSGLEWCPD